MKKDGNPLDERIAGALEAISQTLIQLLQLQRMTLGYTGTEAAETPFQVPEEPETRFPEDPEDVETWLMATSNELSAEQERADERKFGKGRR